MVEELILWRRACLVACRRKFLHEFLVSCNPVNCIGLSVSTQGCAIQVRASDVLAVAASLALLKEVLQL